MLVFVVQASVELFFNISQFSKDFLPWSDQVGPESLADFESLIVIKLSRTTIIILSSNHERSIFTESTEMTHHVTKIVI